MSDLMNMENVTENVEPVVEQYTVKFPTPEGVYEFPLKPGTQANPQRLSRDLVKLEMQFLASEVTREELHKFMDCNGGITTQIVTEIIELWGYTRGAEGFELREKTVDGELVYTVILTKENIDKANLDATMIRLGRAEQENAQNTADIAQTTANLEYVAIMAGVEL